MADPTAREAFRSLLDGNPPDPNIRDLGPFTADYLSLTEVAGSGPAAVIRRFEERVAANPALAQMMAGATDPRPAQFDDPTSTPSQISNASRPFATSTRVASFPPAVSAFSTHPSARASPSWPSTMVSARP